MKKVLIITAADEDKAMMEPTLASLRAFMRDCMEGSVERGVIYGTGAYEKGGVKHWHGAAPDCWFQHIALEVPGTGGRNEWLEPVDDAAYAEATSQNSSKNTPRQ